MTSWFKRPTLTNNATHNISAESTHQHAAGTPHQGNLRQGIGGVGSFFSSVATRIITTISEEKERFMQEREASHSEDATIVPLWLALRHTDAAVVEEARNAILGLTKSKRNFLNAPPEDTSFTFNYQASMMQALAAVNADPKLNMARFCLVPTYIKEEEFWRNWFYRVQIILTAYGLEMPNQSTTMHSSEKSSNNTELLVEDSLSKRIDKELGELGIHTTESTPEVWEEELKKELSSLDPSKEELDSLLSQNWEEELMLELGIKNSSGVPENCSQLSTDNHLASTGATNQCVESSAILASSDNPDTLITSTDANAITLDTNKASFDENPETTITIQDSNMSLHKDNAALPTSFTGAVSPTSVLPISISPPTSVTIPTTAIADEDAISTHTDE